MKSFAPLVGLALVASLAAQSPLTTIFLGPNGLANGGVTFINMTVSVPSITVNRIDVNSNSALGTQGYVRVWQTVTGVSFYSGSETNAANWQVVGEGPVIAAGNDLPSIVCMKVPFTLTNTMGQRGYAIEHIGVGPRYTNGTGTNQTYNNAEISLFAGVAAGNTTFADPLAPLNDASYPFVGALAGGGAARVWNGSIHYAIGGSAPVCSFSERVGLPCGGGFSSWFDVNMLPAQAQQKLQGRQVMMLPTGSTYQVITGPSPGLIPYAGHNPLVGWATTIAGAAALDDGETVTPTFSAPFPHVAGPVSSFVVHTNGMISVASNLSYLDTLAGGGDDWAPQTPAVLGAPNTAWYVWHDFDITTAGAIRFADTGSQVIITYDAVPSAFGAVTGTSTLQLVFDLSSGVITMDFQTVDPVFNGGAPGYSGNPWIIGYSPGGASVRPYPELDASTTSITQLDNADLANTRLTTTRPVFGSLIDYTVANINSGFPLGFLYFSVTNPFAPGLPLSLLGVGKPGCYLNFDLASSIGPFQFAAPGLVLSIDTNTVSPSMLGLDFWGQAIVFDLLAPDLFAGLTSSNAVHQRVEAN